MSTVSRAVTTVLAAALALGLAAAAASGPGAAKQRVQIDTKYPGNSFVLTPLRAGTIERDSGSQGCNEESDKREVLRDGQTAWVWECRALVFTGKHGKLVLRSRYTWIEAGGPYNVATGTWKVVSGTGEYARLAGVGRSARVGTRSMERVRYQGYLTSQ
jgi:hypothetical protein